MCAKKFISFFVFEEILCSKIVAAIHKNGLATDKGWSKFVAAFSASSTSTGPGMAIESEELLNYRHIDGPFYEKKCLEIVATRVGRLRLSVFIYLIIFW